VLLKPGWLLRAKAYRIGFKDSEEARFKLGDPVAVGPVPAAFPHWRTRLDRTDLLVRLRKVKQLDSFGPEAIGSYFNMINYRNGSVRYWTIIGLNNRCKRAEDVERAKKVFKKLLGDASPVVRIAAAHALCDWGREKEGLPVLIDALKYKNNKAGLYAVIALKKIGEKARPALPQIRDCLKDSDGYVKRVTQSILKNLGSV
jgi:HEAT repeat protein